jgi:hypothetical protein
VIVMAPVLEGWAPGGKNRGETLDLLKNFIREGVPAFQYDEMTSPREKAPVIAADSQR